jgi:NAD(P)-dependent dehydrogenase (short-subunit alcohol dehydrogenase family)
MIALTRSLALGRHGVTVNALNAGITDPPLARAAVTESDHRMKLDVLGTCRQPEEIAETMLFLAGTDGGCMTGQLIGTRMRTGA